MDSRSGPRVRVTWGLAALALAVASFPSPGATAPAPDKELLAARLATGSKSLFAAARERNVGTVLLVLSVDPESDPDRRLLLEAIRDGVAKAASAQGLACNASPERSGRRRRLRRPAGSQCRRSRPT
jgi:hypothetical protein